MDFTKIINWVRDSWELHRQAAGALSDSNGDEHRRLVQEGAEILKKAYALSGTITKLENEKTRLKAERRAVCVPVSYDALGHLFKYVSQHSSLPEDAIWCDTIVDERTETIKLYYVHESFDPVPISERLPKIYPVINTQHKTKD